MIDNLIIRKQKFKIKTNNEQLALQLRKQVSDELQYNLLSVYEEAFNSLANIKENVFIDKISIDLGQCSKAEFTESITTILKKALIKHLNDSVGKEFTQYEFNEHEKKTDNGSRHDEQTAFIYFLKNGIYPWWFTGSSVKNPQQLIAEMSNASLENLLIKIITTRKTLDIVSAARMIRRFTQQLSLTNYGKIIGALIRLQSDQQLKNNLEMLHAEETADYMVSLLGITKEGYQKISVEFLLKQSEADHKEVIKKFILYLMEKTSNKANELLKGFKKFQTSKKEDAVKKLVAEIILEMQVKFRTKQEQTKEERSINKQSLTEANETSGEEIYINNGGLVILHPFLQPLFENLNLLDAGNVFVSDNSKFKAAVVLHYLQNSTDQYEEYEMAFNKVLCGIPIEEILPAGIMLNDNEKKECDDLLHTVIKYWEALKGSGKEALQETFICRKAKLDFKEDHWLLQVEKNTMDILINRLPWGFGIIKLPWIQYLIHVEW